MNIDLKTRAAATTSTNRSSAAPVTTNGPSVASSTTAEIRTQDRVVVQGEAKSANWKYWVAAGLAVTGAAAGHLANITPSATVARITGDSKLRMLEELGGFGTFMSGREVRDANSLYRSYGRMEQSQPGDFHRLVFPNGTDYGIHSEESARELHGFLTGEHTFGLNDEQMSQVIELSRAAEYQNELDPHGALLARSVSGYRYDRPSLRYRGARYELGSPSDLSRFHDLYFGGGGHFSEHERQLLPILNEARSANYNLFEILDRLDRGAATQFSYQSPTGPKFKSEIESREELLDFAERLQGQMELDRYRPTPERMDFLVRPHLTNLRQRLSNSATQIESLKGLAGVNQDSLEHNAGRLRQAVSRLDNLELRLQSWNGQDGEALIEQSETLLQEVESLTSDLIGDRWNVYDDSHRRGAADELQRIRNRLSVAEREAAPPGWTAPSVNLEGFTPSAGA